MAKLSRGLMNIQKGPRGGVITSRGPPDGVPFLSRWWQLKYFLFSPRTFGKVSNLTSIFFQMGWFNHQLVIFISSSCSDSFACCFLCSLRGFAPLFVCLFGSCQPKDPCSIPIACLVYIPTFTIKHLPLMDQ